MRKETVLYFQKSAGTKLKNATIVLELTGIEALGILGELQLALRHPSNKNTLPAHAARGVARYLDAEIRKIAPGLAPILDAGWKPSDDGLRVEIQDGGGGETLYPPGK